eukprot:667601-Rhodomonas_salina.1
MSGTELAYAATPLLCHVRCRYSHILLRACYAIPGTDLAYAATRPLHTGPPEGNRPQEARSPGTFSYVGGT